MNDMCYVVEALASRSMNINAKDNFGETAFYVARSGCRMEIEKILKKYGANKFLGIDKDKWFGFPFGLVKSDYFI